jgi:hypothetical protein
MRLEGSRSLNFNNMSTAAVFFDIEKALDTASDCGLLYKLPQLKLLESPIKINVLFLTDRQFKVSVEGKFSTP